MSEERVIEIFSSCFGHRMLQLRCSLKPRCCSYEYRPWGGELAIRQWGTQLVAINIPSNELDKAMTSQSTVMCWKPFQNRTRAN